VGIGTTDPQADLDVAGGVLKVGAAYFREIEGVNPTCTNGASIARFWDPRTCIGYDSCSCQVGPCPPYSQCTTPSGWQVDKPPSCVYSSLDYVYEEGWYCASQNSTCSATSWTRVLCIGS
jgi:hypothetical protein